MREKARIAKLSPPASIEWPTGGNVVFHNYVANVVEVLRANDIDGEWVFDPEYHHFHAVWRRSVDIRTPAGTYISDDRLDARRNVSLDPSKPLADEISRLIAERISFVRWVNAVSRLVSNSADLAVDTLGAT